MISRRILAAVFLLCAFVAPAHAQKTKAAIITEIPLLCPTNQLAGNCTVTNANKIWSDIVNSIMPTGPVVSGNLACFNGTTGLLQDCGSSPTYLPLAGGTMSGNIAMGGFVLTGAGANYVTNTNLAQAAAGTFKGNPTASAANVTDIALSGLSDIGTPSTTLDYLPIINHTTGAMERTSASELVASVSSGVTTFNGRVGTVVPGSSDYTAPQIAYTPPGTGGVQTTVAAVLNRTLWANDYGAVCNGTTDDHGAFQNAINEAQTLGVTASFVGTCYISTGLNVTAALSLTGINNTDSVLSSAAGINALTVTTTGAVNFHDFAISYASTSSGDTALVITATGNENYFSRFQNLYINGAYNGVNFISASLYVFRDCIVTYAGGWGVTVQNQHVADSGDGVITGSLIASTTSSLGAVLWESGGGFRFINNKINTFGAPYGNAIEISLASGAGTGSILIEGNSIEGATNFGILLHRQGTTGTLSRVVIDSNEIFTSLYGIAEATDANGSWLSSVSMTGNNIEFFNSTASMFGYSINTTINGLSIVGGVVDNQASGSATPITIGGTQTSTNCVIGPIPRFGTFTSSSVGSCATVSPF